MITVDSLWQAKSKLGYKWWRLRRAVRSRLSTVNNAPIVVLGNQKTGTTAIAALLAEQTGRSATLDLLEMSAGDERDMHQRPEGLEQFVATHKLEFSRDLIKEPRLTFLYPQLLDRFPHAQYVFVVRDPRDNIRSILNRLELPGQLDQLNKSHWRDVSPEWKLVLDGSWMGLDGRNYIDMLAARWNRAASTYLDHADACCLVRFEDFLESKEATITNLTTRLGLQPTNDISDKVDVQYQPRGDRAISWETFFGASNLQCIEDRCAHLMEPLGYTPQHP
jgi:hypothetical protein